MPYRFRAYFHFDSDPASTTYSPGFAQWCSDQVNQRLTMAFHLNEGAMNEEKSKHEKIGDFEWRADIFVPDHSQAIIEDFWAHILSISVRLKTKVIAPESEEGETEYLPSWMDLHHCHNDVNQPCQQPYMHFATEVPEPGEPGENPCDAIKEWDANEGYWNMSLGDLRKREVGGIWKVYKVINLGFVHYDPAGPWGHHGWEYQYDCPT